VVLNCPGGMNQKGVYQDGGAVLALMRPLFALLERLMLHRPVATWIFDKFR
jgi:hypothetical protein